jgi:DNA topoisomerase I
VAAPPLKSFDPSPVTGNPIELRDGRYGMYVADGETNASLPKDMTADELSFEQAVALLEARAAAGGSKKKGARGKKPATKATKKAAKKATRTTATKAVAKKTTKKSATKKTDHNSA